MAWRFESFVAEHADRLTHVSRRPARPGVVEPWPDELAEPVRRHFESTGIPALWGHQAEAWRQLDDGHHVIVTTGTASGKSLIYQSRALDLIVRGRTGAALAGHRRPTVLYVAPTKALAADQVRRIPAALDEGGDEVTIRAVTLDGDSSRDERNWARDHAALLLTNPDTLHHFLLPSHERWGRFFRGLALVVVDECHHYRGVFGSHVSHVLRRLRRIAAHHGAAPEFVVCSATIAEPEEFAQRLVGVPFAAITDDGSPAAAQTIALWEPPLIPTGDGRDLRVSSHTETVGLVASLVRADLRSLVFVRSRRGAETIAADAREALADHDPQLAGAVATYRGGYLPEERRDLEARLRSGEIRAMTATSALELGIDVSGLDAVVSLGFPGTRASLWQQFGRAGRGNAESLGVLVARDEPIDHHLVRNPDVLLDAPLEQTVLDPDNPYVLGPQLAAAAAEVPLTEASARWFGSRTMEGIEALERAGLLRKRAAGWFWNRRERASDLADLRSSGGRPVSIVEPDTGRLIGTVDASSADRDVHAGAVYLHQGVSHLVREYSVEDAVALAEAVDPPYRTQARSTSAVSITSVREQQRWGPTHVGLGDVVVESQVTSFLMRDARTGRRLGEEPLDLPLRSLPTTAVWWSIPPDLVHELVAPDRVGGAAHAAEHASIALLPILASCDRWDIGGVSTPHHPDTDAVTVFVHDGHPGGAGFAARGFDVCATWLRLTRDAIASCGCEDGCPACIVSPKCGNGNHPLDKRGAVQLLELALRDAPPH